MQEQLYATVNRSVPSVFIKAVEATDGFGVVALQKRNHVDGCQNYFLSNYKQQKILAIETTRWFRDLSWLRSL